MSPCYNNYSPGNKIVYGIVEPTLVRKLHQEICNLYTFIVDCRGQILWIPCAATTSLPARRLRTGEQFKQDGTLEMMRRELIGKKNTSHLQGNIFIVSNHRSFPNSAVTNVVYIYTKFHGKNVFLLL